MASKCFVYICLVIVCVFLSALASSESVSGELKDSVIDKNVKIAESKNHRQNQLQSTASDLECAANAERNIGDYTGIETNGERQANHRTKRRGRKGRKFIKPKPTTPKPTEKPTNRTILPDIKWTKDDCYYNETYESAYDPAGYCFLISFQKNLVRFAEKFCNDIKGYRLVTINSKAKQRAVGKYVKEHKQQGRWGSRWGFFISAMDMDPNGDQYWRSTGQTVRYSRWAGGDRHARNETGPQPCLAIGTGYRMWYRKNCTFFLAWSLCEKVYQPLPEPKPTTPKPRKRIIYPEKRWTRDDCDYTTFKSNNMWSQGVPKGYCFSAPTGASGPGKYMQEYCDRNRKGFRLATINSQEKQNAVAAHLRAHQHTNKNFLLSAIDRDENGELYWRSTGQTVRYTNWAGRHPSGPVPCVAIDRYSFKWMSPDCKKNEYHPFCEKVYKYKRPAPEANPSRKIYKIQKWPEYQCWRDRAKFLPTTSECLKFGNNYKNQTDAKWWCIELTRERGYQLLTINSQAKHNDIVRLLKGKGRIWRYSTYRHEYWLSGIAKDKNGNLYWVSTGQTVKFTNYADKNTRGPQPCVTMDGVTMKWHVRKCSQPTVPLCEKDGLPYI